jgi:hypothetical protein
MTAQASALLSTAPPTASFPSRWPSVQRSRSAESCHAQYRAEITAYWAYPLTDEPMRGFLLDVFSVSIVTHGGDGEAEAFSLLKVGQDFEEVAGLRVAARAEHARIRLFGDLWMAAASSSKPCVALM